MTGIVPTEPELGVQRRCSRCHEWWPADPEFFYRHGDHLHSWCKACWKEARAERDGRPQRHWWEAARGTAAYRERRNAYQRAYRARRAVE